MKSVELFEMCRSVDVCQRVDELNARNDGWEYTSMEDWFDAVSIIPRELSSIYRVAIEKVKRKKDRDEE